MSSKQLRMVLLAVLLIAAAFLFGIVCRRMGVAHRLLVAPFRELLRLLLWLLLVLVLMAVSAGMVAVLFRPRWPAFVVFGLSGLAMVLGWGTSVRSFGLSSLYVAAGIAYTILTRRDLSQRINFSVRPVGQNWRLMTIVLLLLAVGSFYTGFAEHVRDKGLSVPDQQVDTLTVEIAEEVVDETPLSRLDAVRNEGVRQVQRVLKQQVERLLRKVERYIPPLAAVILFLVLFAVTWLFGWVPTLILFVVLPLLTMLRFAEMTTETVEVKRLVVR
jgi:uncharacterized membrane protein YjjP (DUF1212 family)